MREEIKNWLRINWFKIILTFLLILLVNSVIYYVNTETRYIIQKQNFYVWKWYVEFMTKHRAKGNLDANPLLKRFGL